jgi:hypothetical protein
MIGLFIILSMPKLSLEKLINSLSQGELRAFSLSIKKDGNPSYYKLFNDIRSGKHQISKKKDNNETQRRNYLYNSILESLVKSSKTIDSQIAKGLHHAELLYNRQLEKEAWKEIEKAEKLARKHERFGYIIQILEWKKIIGFRLDSFSTQDFRDTSALEKDTINDYLNYLKAADVYHELLIRKKKEGYVQEPEKLPKLSDLQESNSTIKVPKRTLYYQRMAHAVHLCLTQDTQAQYQLTKLIVQDAAVIIETNECLLAYFEHLTSCICVGAFDELISTFSRLKTDIKKGKFGNSQDILIKLFYYAANYEIMAYTFLGESNNLKIKIKEVELGIKKLDDNLSVEMLMLIHSALKMGYYFLGNSEQSKFYINKIQEVGGMNVRMDIYQDSLFFALLLCTDENNVEQMETTLKMIDEQLNLNKPQYKFEREMFQIFSLFVVDKLNKKQLFQELIHAYDQIGQTLPSGLNYTENYYPYYLWAKANQEDNSIMKTAETLSKKYFKDLIF